MITFFVRLYDTTPYQKDSIGVHIKKIILPAIPINKDTAITTAYAITAPIHRHKYFRKVFILISPSQKSNRCDQDY